ncbi:MAG: hypothetical protein PHW72_00640 [Candidatus Pacebacteria bacterium]|nr:hypothetical protein [Candidatus Paceibacterota bacterium]
MGESIPSKAVALTFGVLVISFVAVFYVVAWNDPSANPPENNIATPLNSGPEGQEKEGGLILNTGGAEYGLIVDQGKTKIEGSFIVTPGARPSSPATGQLYFDQGDKGLYFYSGTKWARVGPEECSAPCGTCKACLGGQCVNYNLGTVDPNGCNQTHYRCDGHGVCVAPMVPKRPADDSWGICNYGRVWTSRFTKSGTGTQICQGFGYPACYGTLDWGESFVACANSIEGICSLVPSYFGGVYITCKDYQYDPVMP